MRVLVTGGAGYIGSHTLLQLLQERHEALVFDNFSNSSPEALRRVRRLTNVDFQVMNGDVRDEHVLLGAMHSFRPEAIVHFAGLKSVGESNSQPLEYYSQNLIGAIKLLQAMEQTGCNKIVFSSSATVYGEARYLPYDENHPSQPTNPYGRTKYFTEKVISDWVASRPGFTAVVLRYFNPVGAHPSGLIGEHPSGTPNNLVPYLTQVAAGRLARLRVYGNDYPTRDGTGERDYIHVEDLARAHLAALDYASGFRGYEAINVGTGRGATVLEMIREIEAASGRKVPYEIVARREGDIATSIADVRKAERLLGWKAQYGITEMCRSAWHWQSRNPAGYETSEAPIEHGALLEEVS